MVCVAACAFAVSSPSIWDAVLVCFLVFDTLSGIVLVLSAVIEIWPNVRVVVAVQESGSVGFGGGGGGGDDGGGGGDGVIVIVVTTDDSVTIDVLVFVTIEPGPGGDTTVVTCTGGGGGGVPCAGTVTIVFVVTVIVEPTIVVMTVTVASIGASIDKATPTNPVCLVTGCSSGVSGLIGPCR